MEHEMPERVIGNGYCSTESLKKVNPRCIEFKLLEHYKMIIGEPQFKHKIVLGVVSPITDQNRLGKP